MRDTAMIKRNKANTGLFFCIGAANGFSIFIAYQQLLIGLLFAVISVSVAILVVSNKWSK